MIDQPDLFAEVAAARTADPSTSREAAATVHVADLEARVLRALRQSFGMTTSELSSKLKLDRVTVSPRIAPLCRKGLVVDSGARRSGPSGRRQIVWRAAA
jgi:DNA-binding MarR family transcriptional regulator